MFVLCVLLELVLASLFSLNALFDFWKYFKYTMSPSTIAVTPQQHNLLGLRNTSKYPFICKEEIFFLFFFLLPGNCCCFYFDIHLTDIQASPPQKPEKKEAPAPDQTSPLQGQSVLSFSPSRPASSSPKFSPSCTAGYSPPLGSPSPSGSAGGPFTPSVAFGKVHDVFNKQKRSQNGF